MGQVVGYGCFHDFSHPLPTLRDGVDLEVMDGGFGELDRPTKAGFRGDEFEVEYAGDWRRFCIGECVDIWRTGSLACAGDAGVDCDHWIVVSSEDFVAGNVDDAAFFGVALGVVV